MKDLCSTTPMWSTPLTSSTPGRTSPTRQERWAMSSLTNYHLCSNATNTRWAMEQNTLENMPAVMSSKAMWQTLSAYSSSTDVDLDCENYHIIFVSSEYVSRRECVSCWLRLITFTHHHCHQPSHLHHPHHHHHDHHDHHGQVDKMCPGEPDKVFHIDAEFFLNLLLQFPLRLQVILLYGDHL